MDKYNKLLNLLLLIGISEDKIDKDKLKRQVSIINTWLENGAIGFLEAITGFGKTWVGVFADYLMKDKYPHYETIVVVPTIKLKQQWLEIIDLFSLTNIEVHVINSYTQDPNKVWQCDLLIVDEVHRCLSVNALQFNRTIRITKFKGFLGLSATLSKEEQDVLVSLGINKIDKISKAEGKRMNFVSEYTTYNLGLTMTEPEREEYARYNDIHNSSFARFMYFPFSDANWQFARACSAAKDKRIKVGETWRTAEQWRNWYASEMGWNGQDDHEWSPKSIANYANQWSWAMRKRKEFLYNFQRKLDTAIDIIARLENRRIITFGETTNSADYITNTIGPECRSYHSNITSEIYLEDRVDYRKTLKGAKAHALKLKGKIGNLTDEGYPIYYQKEVTVGKDRVNAQTIKDFSDNNFRCINTAKALNEGFNVEGIDCAIIYSRPSTARVYIQRIGRAIRFVEGKEAIIVNIYVKGTQDETWLRKSQVGETNIRWIENINQLPLKDVKYTNL